MLQHSMKLHKHLCILATAYAKHFNVNSHKLWSKLKEWIKTAHLLLRTCQQRIFFRAIYRYIRQAFLVLIVKYLKKKKYLLSKRNLNSNNKKMQNLKNFQQKFKTIQIQHLIHTTILKFLGKHIYYQPGKFKDTCIIFWQFISILKFSI